MDVHDGVDAQSTPRRQVPFRQALAAGAVAGLSVDLLFFPLDTLKTRLQAPQGFWAAGGVRGVYRGVGSVGVGGAPGAAAFFTTYESLKKVLPGLGGVWAGSEAVTHMTAASGGELVACLIRVPTEVVKSLAQTSGPGMAGRTRSWGEAVALAQREGIRGFYRGFGITVAREIPFTSIQFPLYEYLKSTLSRRYLANRKPLAHEAAVCGMIAGGVGAALTTPLDVVKTRVMLEAKGPIGAAAPAAETAALPSRPSASVLSIPSRLVRIARDEGPGALFRGVVPRTIWISLGGAVFLGVYEAVVDVMHGVGV